MEYSNGDLWDRWIIERRKQIYGANNATVVKNLYDAIIERGDVPAEFVFVIAELAMANDSISLLEWQIRADHKLSDEEVGIRARAVRTINVRRVNAKNMLDGRGTEFVPAFELDLAKVNLAVPDSAK